MSFSDDDTRPLPVIGDASTIRIRLGLLIATFTAVVMATSAGAIWATTIHSAQERQEQALLEIRQWTHEFDRRLDHLEDRIGRHADRNADHDLGYTP